MNRYLTKGEAYKKTRWSMRSRFIYSSRYPVNRLRRQNAEQQSLCNILCFSSVKLFVIICVHLLNKEDAIIRICTCS
uniref:Uncharacterized protein n=1 Tax=Populus trichocarpa TaxID=3694 RepID=A0A2K2B8U9_POPTR